jgi:uncharacterized protein YyaL (SSP411 family)
MREMQSPDGGYYSAQDADSEGTEGKFFVWPQNEINELLESVAQRDDIDTESTCLFKDRFGLNLNENFEGSWHLHGYQQEAALASNNQKDPEELHQKLLIIRQYLFRHRENRIHPDTDTKILCAWNGLMIHGMAITGRLLDKPECTESASRAAYFLKKHCWQNNQLFASTKDGKTTLNAYIDDYAFLIYGLLELLQNKWDNNLYMWALALADKLLTDFEDNEYGGFFFTSHNHENLIQRLKSFSDDAIPSGNAIASLALNRLGHLSGDTRYIESAEKCLKSAWSAINQAPISHCALLTALSEFLTPPNILIMRTTANDEIKWQSLAQQFYLPFTLVYNIPTDQTLHSSLEEKVGGDSSLAYPCNGHQCQQPLKTETDLQTYLRNNSYRVLE